MDWVSISLRDVGHTYESTPVLSGLNLELDEGELLCVLGPSGSGKSTILKLLAGLEPLQAGSISLGSLEITPADCPRPEHRPIGLVFQEHALFPHLSVEQNVAFGLSKVSAEDRSNRVETLLASIELEELRDRLPSMLSGGQQQRVALARALAPEPKVLLLDEPFASVDVLLKNRLRKEMREILKSLGSTSVLVTHDPEDAMMVADRVAVIVAGQLAQIGSPQQLWERPAHPFVAEMFAGKQLLDATKKYDVVVTGFGNFQGVDASHCTSEEIILAVDPSEVTLSHQAGSPVMVSEIRFVGGKYQTLLSAGNESLMAVSSSAPTLEVGQSVALTVAADTIHAYNRE
jgi:iron(III) transport system ATP-binding protein